MYTTIYHASALARGLLDHLNPEVVRVLVKGLPQLSSMVDLRSRSEESSTSYYTYVILILASRTIHELKAPLSKHRGVDVFGQTKI